MPKKKTPTRPTQATRAALPHFTSEAEERAFWQEQDSAEYVDWSKAERIRLPNLKPSTTTISLRLPAGMLDELKVLANQRDVPYQSLLKLFLADRLAAERDRKRRAS
jgi:predicted DNA binding CopG/RHH family protein